MIIIIINNNHNYNWFCLILHIIIIIMGLIIVKPFSHSFPKQHQTTWSFSSRHLIPSPHPPKSGRRTSVTGFACRFFQAVIGRAFGVAKKITKPYLNHIQTISKPDQNQQKHLIIYQWPIYGWNMAEIYGLPPNFHSMAIWGTDLLELATPCFMGLEFRAKT